MSGLVLSLCDLSGVMVEPWLDAGYECMIVDLQHAPGVATEGRLHRVGADIETWLPPRCDYEIVFGFPPCTDLAVSGARWFKDKGLASLASALGLVDRCRRVAEWSDAPWMLENPVSTLSTYWRKPDYSFDPCDYAGYSDPTDAYTKRTCIWSGGGFQMPPTSAMPPTLGSKMHLLPPSPERANLRSVTPQGFARAVYQANAPLHVAA